jgi:phosphatidylserine decarboxylase
VLLREGAVPIAVTGVLALLVSGVAGWLAGGALWLATGWLCWLYWEHRPPVPADPVGVLAPVAGRVIAVTRDRDPWLERAALRVQLRVPFPGVVPLRSPTEGKVMDLYARRGVFGTGQRPCAPGESPDCYGQWLRTDEGEDVVYALSSRWPASRARFDHAPGERVGQGARSGFFYLASVADVLLPEGSSASVAVGDRVFAGESVLGRLRRG